MKSLIRKTLVIMIIVNPTFATSKRSCKGPPKEILEKYNKIVSKSKTVKYLKNQNREVKIQSYSCDGKEGFITISGHDKVIQGKNCRFSPSNYKYKIVGNSVFFNDIKYKNKNISLKTYFPKLIHQTLIKIAKDSIVSNFFKNNTLCQVEFRDSHLQDHLIIQLRQKRRFCFVKSSLDGKSIEIIKRQYAKNSQCL